MLLHVGAYYQGDYHLVIDIVIFGEKREEVGGGRVLGRGPGSTHFQTKQVILLCVE